MMNMMVLSRIIMFMMMVMSKKRRQQQHHGKTPLKFTEYRQYLAEISRQLQLPNDDNIILQSPLPQPNMLNDIRKNSSSSSYINRTEYVNMNFAKKEMLYTLKHKRGLIVLDNVWRCKDPWFDFWDENEGKSDDEDEDIHLLVTTQNQNIMPHCIDCCYGLIDVPKMNTNESITCF